MSPESSQPDLSPSASRSAVPSRREAAASGGDTSNTPPSIPITHCPGGEDWLELALYLNHENFSQLEEKLEIAKEQAEALDAGPVELLIGGRSFVVLPGAATVGDSHKPLKYRWRLQAPDGWVLLLMRRAMSHQTMPNGIARASSLALLRIGTKAYEEQLRETLAALDIRLVGNKVSRVDPCVDLKDTRIDSLYEAFIKGHYVTRARHSSEHISEEHFQGYRVNRRPSGFRLGVGAVCLRVYDKGLECRNNGEKLMLMQTRRWGCIGGDAIRVEFQVRRPKLKELGIDSLHSWYEKRGSVVEYLSTKWCWITASAVDSSHADRTPVHPDWLAVQRAFADWAGESIAKLAPLPKVAPPADDLLQQIVGALCSYHARSRRPIKSNDEFMERTHYEINRAIRGRCMTEEIRLRKLKLGVSQ